MLTSLPNELLWKSLQYLSPADLHKVTLVDNYAGVMAKQLYYKDIYLLANKDELASVVPHLGVDDDFNPLDEFSYLQYHNVFYDGAELARFVAANPDLSLQNLILSSHSQIPQVAEIINSFKSISILNKVCLDLGSSGANLPFKHVIVGEQGSVPANVQELTVENGNSQTIGQIPVTINKLSLINTPISMDQLAGFPYLQELQLFNSINEPFTAALPNLKSLLINNFAKLGDLSKLPQLSRLELYNVNDNNLLLPRQLSHLTLGDGRKLTSLSSIINQVPNLKGLNLSLYFVCNYPDFYKINYPDTLQELSIRFDQECYLDIYDEINNVVLPKNLNKLSIINGEDLLLSNLKLPESLNTFIVDNICGFTKNFVLPKSIKNLKLNNIFDYNEDFFPAYLQHLVINNCYLTSAPFHYLADLKSLTINDNTLMDLNLPNNLSSLNVTSDKLSGLTIPPNNYNYTNNYYSNSNLSKLILNLPNIDKLDLPVENLNYLSLGNTSNSMNVTLPESLTGLVLNNNTDFHYNIPESLSMIEQH